MKSKLSTRFRYETSFRGYAWDELKSALQKYVRRGNLDKALYFYLETESFGFPHLEIEPKMNRGEGLRTNMLHRLMIIYLEDIGPANFNLWSTMDKNIFKMIKLREERKKNPEIFEKNRKLEINIGAGIIKNMVESQHSRQLSHINTCICNIDFLTKPNEDLIKEIKQYTHPEAAKNFIKSLQDKSFTAFYFMKKIYNRTSPGKFYRSTHPIFYIIHLVSKYLPEDIIEIAVRWAKEIKDENFLIPLLLLSKILNIFTDGPSPSETLVRDGPSPHETLVDGEINFSDFLLKSKKELDGYVIDKHTKRGIKMGKTKKDWIKEGSVVNNEWREQDKSLKTEYEKINLYSGTRYNKAVVI